MGSTCGSVLRATAWLAVVALPSVARSEASASDDPGLTRVEFSSDTDEPQFLSLYMKVAPESWDFVLQCQTPCVLQLPLGSHELMVGAHRTFTVVADGGPQAWRVEDNNLRGIVAGAVLTGVGPLLPPVFMIGRLFYGMAWGWWTCREDECEFFNDGMNTALIVAGSLGGAMLVAGLVIWVMSYGRSERIAPTADGAIDLPRGLRLNPGLFDYESPGRRHNLGLALTLHF